MQFDIRARNVWRLVRSLTDGTKATGDARSLGLCVRYIGEYFSAHVKTTCEIILSNSCLMRSFVQSYWHRNENMKNKTREEMLKLAVVEISDR